MSPPRLLSQPTLLPIARTLPFIRLSSGLFVSISARARMDLKSQCSPLAKSPQQRCLQSVPKNRRTANPHVHTSLSCFCRCCDHQKKQWLEPLTLHLSHSFPYDVFSLTRSSCPSVPFLLSKKFSRSSSMITGEGVLSCQHLLRTLSTTCDFFFSLHFSKSSSPRNLLQCRIFVKYLQQYRAPHWHNAERFFSLHNWEPLHGSNEISPAPFILLFFSKTTLVH